jgi:hyperosmotically inducible periplasmic protein
MNAKFLAASGLVAALLSSPIAANAESFKEAVKDSLITAKIKAEMAKDKTVSASTITVETDANGKVQLGGTAKSKSEARKAVSLAKSVKGVTSVSSHIKVEPSGQPETPKGRS